MTVIRLAVLPDFLEEGWPSMNRCAAMLLARMPAGIASARCGPRFRRLASGFGRTGFNADRLFNRFVTYPRYARRLVDRFDAFHVADHTYAHLVHTLPAARTGSYCHDLDAFRCLIEPKRDPRPRWFRAMARRTLTGLQAAARVFPISRQVRDDLVRFGLIDPARLVVAPLGAAPEFAAIPPSDPVQVPWVDGLVGRPWVLHVGSCAPRKRVDVLLSAIAIARRDVPGLALVKAGGEWTDGQRAQIDRLGLCADVFHVRGASDAALAELYRRAAVVLIPSESEGFGLPVVEALACGAVVVASDIPVFREIAGSAVVYVPVGEAAACADAIRRVLADPNFPPPRADRLARAGRFTWDAHAATIAAAYKAVLSTGY